MITLFGATGYTGRLIAHTLDREKLPFRIAGRSEEKLAALSAELGATPEWLVADALRPATLPALFHGSRMLINCAGPFTDLGEKVIAQAAMAGVHYLDMTNELGYVFRARSYDEMARRTGSALVPACGFEVAFADCAANLLGQQMVADPNSDLLDEINVVYALGGTGASRGTRKSAVRSLATSWIAYRDGDWVGQVPGGRVRKFALPGASGSSIFARHALNFPSSESVTLPAHLPVRRVDAWMTTTPGARFWAPVLIPLFARVSRSILRPLILSIAERGGASPAGALDIGVRADSPFTILVQVRQGKDIRWTAMQGKDPYGLTAKIAAYMAARMTAPGYERSGLLAPSQAADPAQFLAHAQEHWGLIITQGTGESA